MNKGIKNTDNYFERVKQRANRTNYRYYFFDYLYFKGEVWGKKIGRMSGFILLFWYWWWIVVLPGNFLLINSVPQWSSLHLGYLGAMFLLICVFILARYRKARVQALLNRYRRFVGLIAPWRVLLSNHRHVQP
jgi:DMSO/TMAO reductase YedYZ heme-binding membrane subunit